MGCPQLPVAGKTYLSNTLLQLLTILAGTITMEVEENGVVNRLHSCVSERAVPAVVVLDSCFCIVRKPLNQAVRAERP
jgi:hypothetical protein